MSYRSILRYAASLALALMASAASIYAQDEEVVSVSRNYKKIVPIDKFNKNWTIQIMAMKRAPKDANFFDGLDNTYEVIGQDGWRRYYVGQYDTKKEADDMLKLIKRMNEMYKDAFVIKTNAIKMDKSAYRRAYRNSNVNIWQIKEDSLIEARRVRDSINAEKIKSMFKFAPETEVDTIAEKAWKDAQADEIASEKKAYAVQILASRYPIYKKEIYEFDNIEEFYMPDDKVYRYTTGKSDGEQVQKDLKKAIDAGYTEAIIIDYNAYKEYLVK